MKKAINRIGNYKILKIVLAAVVIALPVCISGLDAGNFITLLGCYGFVYAIAVSGLDILFGYCGQISLGHAAYFAIGAYGCAMMNHYWGIPVFIAMIISCFLSAGIAAVIAFPAVKLKFHFLSLATIAFAEIVYFVLGNSPNNITGNFVGFFPANISIFGYEMDTYMKFYYFSLIMLVIAVVFKNLLIKSKVGRSFIAIRENVTAAGGMGINIRKYKVLAFSTSAFYTALAGALLGAMLNYISPVTFTMNTSVMFLTMLLLGGRSSTFGPIIGAFAVQLINELFRSMAYLQIMMYAVVLLIVILVIPSGLVNIKDIVMGKIHTKKTKKEGSQDA